MRSVFLYLNLGCSLDTIWYLTPFQWSIPQCFFFFSFVAMDWCVRKHTGSSPWKERGWFLWRAFSGTNVCKNKAFVSRPVGCFRRITRNCNARGFVLWGEEANLYPFICVLQPTNTWEMASPGLSEQNGSDAVSPILEQESLKDPEITNTRKSSAYINCQYLRR